MHIAPEEGMVDFLKIPHELQFSINITFTKSDILVEKNEFHSVCCSLRALEDEL